MSKPPGEQANASSEAPSKGPATPRAHAEEEGPRRERRSRHRVLEEQGSGSGSASALSKLRMLERRREQVKPRRGDEF